MTASGPRLLSFAVLLKICQPFLIKPGSRRPHSAGTLQLHTIHSAARLAAVLSGPDREDDNNTSGCPAVLLWIQYDSPAPGKQSGFLTVLFYPSFEIFPADQVSASRLTCRQSVILDISPYRLFTDSQKISCLLYCYIPGRGRRFPPEFSFLFALHNAIISRFPAVCGVVCPLLSCFLSGLF